MCLTVKEVPTRFHPAIIRCRKDLDYDSGVDRTTTPILGTVVSSTGWLFAHGRRAGVELDASIGSGAIHAYGHMRFVENMNLAYAFGVFAYGVYYYDNSANSQVKIIELVCHALYIPDCDKNANRRQKTLALINSIGDRPKLTDDDMNKFPIGLRRAFQRYA